MASTVRADQEGQANAVLATVVHDLRNYLQGILGYTELLLKEQEAGKTLRDPELLRQLRRNALGAKWLVANYLDVHRIEAGLFTPARQPVHLGEFLAQVGARYAPEAQ